MQGLLFFHVDEWKKALEAFSHAKTIYEKIAPTVDEDTRVLYKQRVDEMTPQIRFCAYNLDKSDASAVEDLIKMRLEGSFSDFFFSLCTQFSSLFTNSFLVNGRNGFI